MKDSSIKVGMIADQTGPLSFVGIANANVARMIVDDINASGGLLGRRLELFVEDSATIDSVAEAKAGIGSWLGFYNEERQHQSLGYRTPRQAYEAECRWICGRSASPTGCAFAHIPTGTTANHRIDVDEEDYRSDVVTVAPAAIGAGVKIGGVTP